MTSNQIKPVFTEKEILSIREGIDGVKHVLPARFYYDKDLYEMEKEKILKKNWLCVGRWDEAEKPGDYFTVRMWGQSIIIVRDKEKQLQALINVCQHRWSQVVEDGRGNAKLFMCPYHRWTYELDGKLRGMTCGDIPGVDKNKCAMPSLSIEEWQGFIFINFDADAKPLAPQLKGINWLFDKHEVGTYRLMDSVEYDTTWNHKCSFENAYEAYHHVGLHHDRFNHLIPGGNNEPYKFGEIWGSGLMHFKEDIPFEIKNPFGRSPWMEDGDPDDVFVSIYLTLNILVRGFEVLYLITRHGDVDSNRGCTGEAFAPWVINNPDNKELVAAFNKEMRHIQDEDSYGATMLQKGLTARTNTGGLLHPKETQLNHFHNWYMDQMMSS